MPEPEIKLILMTETQHNSLIKLETVPAGEEIEIDIGIQCGVYELLITFIKTKKQQKKHIVLDASTIARVGASGLWTLYEVYKTAKKLGCCFTLINPTPYVAKVLEITRMDQHLCE